MLKESNTQSPDSPEVSQPGAVSVANADDDVVLRLEANQHRAAGLKFLEEGKIGAAISAGEQAVRLLRQADQRFPNQQAWTPQRVDCHRLLGDAWHARRNSARAMEEYRLAIALQKRCRESQPDNVSEQQRLAVLEQKLGDAAIVQGNLALAKESFLAAEALLAEIENRQPDNTAWPRGRAVLFDKRGRLAMALGAMEEAQTLFQSALTIRQAAARKLPGEPLPQREVAGSHIRWGDWHLAQSDLAKAEERYRLARQIVEPMSKLHPDCLETCHEFSLACEKLGELALRRGDVSGRFACIEIRWPSAKKSPTPSPM